MPTRQDVERDRLELLAALERDHAEGPDWQARFAPGTFGCHEALHLASVLASMVDEHLAEHPAIVLNARLVRARLPGERCPRGAVSGDRQDSSAAVEVSG